MMFVLQFQLVPPLVEEWSPPLLDSDSRVFLPREGVIALKRPLLAIGANGRNTALPAIIFGILSLTHSIIITNGQTDKKVTNGTIISQ